MSNYVKSTNFTAKDSLPTGDTNKVIRGSEFDTEFNAIATAVATKSDLAGPTFTGTATFDGITATGTVNFTGGSVTTNIDGGTIDGVTIGGSTPGAGTFSSLVATTADINAGTVDNTVIGGTTPAAGTFSSLTATTANIDGGNIDGTVIGASSTAAISGTTGTFSGAVSGTTGTFSGAVTGSNLNVTNWNTAYGWGDHSTQGYLTSVTFSDIDAGAVTTSGETFANSDTQIPTNAAVRNWVLTTYPTIVEQNNLTLNVTWANVPDANITQSSVTQHQAALSITASQLSDVTSTAAELNVLDGITATTAELNYTDGVTSNIQTQLDSKVGANYTGDVDITGELLVDSYNETFKKVSSVSSINAFDLANASYESKSFAFTTQDGDAYALAFKSDGTKMYMVGSVGDNVYQYSLSTAYDVSTASYDSVSFDISGQSILSRDIRFNASGSKMYIMQYQGTIYEYDLSTAWDLSTASYNSASFAVSTQDSAPYSIFFKTDGTKLFVVGATNDSVFQYSLSTAFDITSASYDSVSFSVSSETTSPTGLVFSSDGTTMLVGDRAGTAEVFKYTLSTAWDLSTASYASESFATETQTTDLWDIVINDNGTKLYALGNLSDTVHQYSMGGTIYTSTFDCENANVFETELDGNTTVVFSNPPASGTPVVTGQYNFSIASYDSVSLATGFGNISELSFNNNGTKLYVVSESTDAIYQYSLSTAYDLNTATYDSVSFSLTSQDLVPNGLVFNSNGTKLYITGNGNDSVFQYSLSTAYDLSTISYDSVSLSVASQDTSPQGVEFNSDGTKLYVVGASSDSVHQYSLSTAYDLSTASYDSVSFSFSSQDSTPRSIRWNNNGTKLYVLGDTNNTVFQYSLSTAYDISTLSYDSVSFSVASQDTAPYGLVLNGDGTKFYIAGALSGNVYQYSLGTSTLNDSTAYAMSLKVVQDSGASGYTVTWPTSVDWPSATAPTLTATASAVDQFVFYTYDGGTTWYGFTAGQALG